MYCSRSMRVPSKFLTFNPPKIPFKWKYVSVQSWISEYHQQHCQYINICIISYSASTTAHHAIRIINYLHYIAKGYFRAMQIPRFVLIRVVVKFNILPVRVFILYERRLFCVIVELLRSSSRWFSHFAITQPYRYHTWLLCVWNAECTMIFEKNK